MKPSDLTHMIRRFKYASIFKKAGFTLLDTAFLWGASGVSAVNWTKSPNLRREWTCDWQHEREKDVIVEVHHTRSSVEEWRVWVFSRYGKRSNMEDQVMAWLFGHDSNQNPGPGWGNLTLNLQTNVKLQRKSKPDDSKYSLINLGWNLSRVCYDSKYLIFTDFEKNCSLFEDIHNTGIKCFIIYCKRDQLHVTLELLILHIFLCVLWLLICLLIGSMLGLCWGKYI